MASVSKVLIVDDEQRIVEVVRSYLVKEGYTVVQAGNGIEALELYRREEPDLVVLDLMMPGMDGWEVCKRIRAESAVPIIMLTAKSQVEDRVEGLSIGADDYLVKPFSPKELVARIRAVLRRTGEEGRTADVLELDGGRLKIDMLKQEVIKDGRNAGLTQLEFNILKTLASNPGRVYSRETLIYAVLGYDYEGYDRTIDTHIKNIRNKIEDNKRDPRYIKTIYGAGYKFGG
ncbi:MAG: Two-component transcriptional response regulator, LuxR family [Firmicutes bacterium]|nr:Two-component transcriptional response regulator, LuxR family [Bacillota bacterium]MDI6706878.1 response regulator transcription factor [Bacillota bacterium]